MLTMTSPFNPYIYSPLLEHDTSQGDHLPTQNERVLNSTSSETLSQIRSGRIPGKRKLEDEATANPPKKRSLASEKCEFCRSAKKACTPRERNWPRQKCERCLEKHLACSEPIHRKNIRSVKVARTPNSAPHDKATQTDLGLEHLELRPGQVPSSGQPISTRDISRGVHAFQLLSIFAVELRTHANFIGDRVLRLEDGGSNSFPIIRHLDDVLERLELRVSSALATASKNSDLSIPLEALWPTLDDPLSLFCSRATPDLSAQWSVEKYLDHASRTLSAGDVVGSFLHLLRGTTRHQKYLVESHKLLATTLRHLPEAIQATLRTFGIDDEPRNQQIIGSLSLPCLYKPDGSQVSDCVRLHDSSWEDISNSTKASLTQHILGYSAVADFLETDTRESGYLKMKGFLVTGDIGGLGTHEWRHLLVRAASQQLPDSVRGLGHNALGLNSLHLVALFSCDCKTCGKLRVGLDVDFLLKTHQHLIEETSVDGVSPLHLAAAMGRVRTCKIMARNLREREAQNTGIDMIFKQDSHGGSPASYAARFGHSRTLEALLKEWGKKQEIGRKYPDDSQGCSILMLGMKCCSAETIKKILPLSSIDSVDDRNLSAVYYAVGSGDISKLILVLRCRQPGLRTALTAINNKGQSILTYALLGKEYEMAREIIRTPDAPISHPMKDGTIPLLWLIGKGQFELAKMIVESRRTSHADIRKARNYANQLGCDADGFAEAKKDFVEWVDNLEPECASLGLAPGLL